MSVSSTMRQESSFRTQMNQGRPLIFWEQQAIEKKNKAKRKNLGYQSRQQKHPLRTKVTENETTVMVHKPGAPRPPGGAAAGRQSDVDKGGTSGPRRYPPKNPPTSKKRPAAAPGAVPADGVSLTQNQLDTILETIGKLTIENSKLKAEVELGGEHATDSGEHKAETVEPTSVPGLDLGNDDGAVHVEPTSVPGLDLNASMTVEPHSVPGLGDAGTTNTNTVVSPRQEQNAEHTAAIQSNVVTSPQTTTSPRQPAPVVLTAAERKKLQWQKDREEEAKLSDFNPWGRPGCGAPPKQIEQQPQLPSVPKTGEPPPSTIHRDHAGNQTAAVTVHQQQQQQASVLAQGTTTDVAAPTAAPSSVQPAAVRSSFAMGNPVPNEGRFESAKDREKRLWLDELDRQRVEQQQRKEQEKHQKMQPGLQDTWADRFTTYKPQTLPQQGIQCETAPTTQTQPAPATGQDVGNRVNSAPNAATTTTPAVSHSIDLNASGNSTYLRGQNVHMDPITENELREKRRKEQEYQDFIKAQIEERERLKREERERRMREDQIEEERLAAERQRQQNQILQEQNKARQKEEEQQRRLDALKEAMDKAHHEAELEKQRRFAQHLPPESRAQHVSPVRNAGQLSTRVDDHGVMTIEPSYVPGLDFGSHPPADAGPESFRVLTPTSHQQAMKSRLQDSMTQTTQGLLSKESTHIEYADDIQEPSPPPPPTRKHPAVTGKKVRVQSAPEEEKPKRTKKPVKISERPNWNAPKNKKPPMKQSEKDPFYHERRMKREAAMAQRREALQTLVDRNTPLIPEVETVSTKTRSRSMERGRKGSTGKSPVKSTSVRAFTSPVRSPTRQVDVHRSPTRAHPPAGGRHYRPTHQSPRHECQRDPSPPIPTLKKRPSQPLVEEAGRHSPPIPTMRHRSGPPEETPPPLPSHRTTHRDKYLDDGPITAPLNHTDFVPFIRSSNVLDPSEAQQPLPVSREASAVTRARKAYVEERQPGKYGTIMENIQDPTSVADPTSKHRKDPIMNPGLVTDHPTVRQDKILQQLSDLRRGLRQKQLEVEIGLVPTMEPDENLP